MDAIAICSLAAEENNPKAQIALSKLYSGTLMEILGETTKIIPMDGGCSKPRQY